MKRFLNGHKFAGALRQKVAAIFGEIPAQLSRHEKKFSVTSLKDGARMRDFDGAFEWLKEAMTVNICYGASEPNVGLRLNMDRTSRLPAALHDLSSRAQGLKTGATCHP